MPTVEEAVRQIISREIQECDTILRTDEVTRIKDFVRGFKLGLNRTKRYSLDQPQLIKLYGKFREDEDKEYRRKRVNVEKVRLMKGKVHAIASVMSLIQEALYVDYTPHLEIGGDALLRIFLNNKSLFMQDD